MQDDRDILDLFHSVDAADGDAGCVLATVVDVVGSSYRRPGARLLVARDGRRAGSISGGCLENDLARRAWAVTAPGASVVAYDTRGGEEAPAASTPVGGGFNTGCEGLIRVLVERVQPGDAAGLLDGVRNRATGGSAAPEAVVFGGARGGLPLGARARPGDGSPLSRAVWPDGVGVSGGLWEAPWPVCLTPTHAGEAAIEVLVQPFHPRRTLWLFGDGDDARPVTELADAAGWRVRLRGRRPLHATARRFPAADDVACGTWPDLLRGFAPGPRDAVLLMTHDLHDDAAVLPAALRSNAFHVGLLGPKRRVGRLMQALHTAGALPDPALLDKLHTPVGLDLGGDGAFPVALSIVAGLQAAVHERPGTPLRERRGPIHPESPEPLAQPPLSHPEPHRARS